MVIQLASRGKTTREIAQTVHVSLLDIGKIIRRFTGEESEYQNKDLSITSKAFQMFKENKSRIDVAISLNLVPEQVNFGRQSLLFQILRTLMCRGIY